MSKNNETIIVLDFGSQVTQLIARRIREINIYCEILPYTTPVEELRKINLKGIILSGGPASVHLDNAPIVDKALYDLKVPILGICYGLQVTAFLNNGIVEPSNEREFGRTEIKCDNSSDLFYDLPKEQTVWMSHGDRIKDIPNVEVIAESENCHYAGIKIPQLNFYGVQFHPEVVHTEYGEAILKNFAMRICDCSGSWSMGDFISEEIARIQEEVGDERVLLGLSGGVDSSVAAVLIHKAIGDNLTCVFVDNGLLRKDEAQSVQDMYKEHIGNAELIFVDAKERFLNKLKGITDPERKRKIIGYEFIEVFRDEAEKIKQNRGDVKFLGQGTLYPDVIESKSVHGGPASVIKSHHNVGGLPDDLELSLLEPFKFLFKDEVRKIGTCLGMDDALVWRQPFPGPGLGIRILEDITVDKIETLQEADAIVRFELEAAGLNKTIWQYFAVLLPVKTVGVMGDERTYENVCAIRAITATDGMTGDWAHIPYDILGKMSSRIINEVHGINRVVYDITSKPPGTIEWE